MPTDHQLDDETKHFIIFELVKIVEAKWHDDWSVVEVRFGMTQPSGYFPCPRPIPLSNNHKPLVIEISEVMKKVWPHILDRLPDREGEKICCHCGEVLLDKKAALDKSREFLSRLANSTST